MISSCYILFLILSFFAALNDFLYYRIPNILVLAILLVAILKITQQAPAIDFYMMGFIFIITLLTGYLLNAFKIMGAGDAKLLSVSVLWMAPEDVVTYLLYMTLIGGGLALLYSAVPDFIDYLRIRLRNFIQSLSFTKESWVIGKYIDLPFTPARAGGWRTTLIPYGIAIFSASSVMTYFYLMR